MEKLDSEVYLMLMNLTKAEINEYRKLLECDVKSNLNKADMALGVAQYIEEESEFWLRRIPTWELALLDKLIKLKPGEKFDAGCQPMESILVQLRLMNQELNPDNLHALYSLTPAMHRSIRIGLRTALAYVIAQAYPLLDQFVMGVLNIYGLIPKPVLASYVFHASMHIAKELGEEDPDGLSGYFYAEESLLMNYNTIDSEEGLQFVYHPCVEPSIESFNTILSCPKTIQFKKFSTEEFLDSGEGFPYITESLNTTEGAVLIQLLEKITASRDYAELLFSDIYIMLQEEDEEGLGVLNLSFSEARHISAQLMREFKDALQAYKEVMPRWDLRGHSISEIRGAGKSSKTPKRLNPLDYVQNKVEPNKPCPCGSGKKYKDCHGLLS